MEPVEPIPLKKTGFLYPLPPARVVPAPESSPIYPLSSNYSYANNNTYTFEGLYKNSAFKANDPRNLAAKARRERLIDEIVAIGSNLPVGGAGAGRAPALRLPPNTPLIKNKPTIKIENQAGGNMDNDNRPSIFVPLTDGSCALPPRGGQPTKSRRNMRKQRRRATRRTRK